MGVNLHVDLETLQLIQGPGQRSPVSSLCFKRGDSARLQVAFLENGVTPVTIGDPALLEIQIGIKPRNQFERTYLAHGADWSMPAEGDDAPVYECGLSFNTLQLNSALNIGSTTAEELSEVILMGEITWREGAGEPTSTRTFLAVVENDVNRGGEDPPVTLIQDEATGTTLLAGNALPTATGGTFALISDIPTSLPPAAHKSSHYTGGSDAISPANIGAVASNPAGIAGAQAITNIVRITQSAYDALVNPDPTVTFITTPG